MGQNMGQKCGLAMGRPNRQHSPPNLDLRHIQDHFGFTFPRVALNGFSRGFSLPVFEPSTGTGRFSPSAVNLLPRFQHGSKTWVRLFPFTPGRDLHPSPRCRDCTIAFRNCKSFLPKRNCRRTASSDTTQRQLTIGRNQIKGVDQLENFGGFTGFPAKVLGPGSDREKYIFAALVVPKSWLEPEFCT